MYWPDALFILKNDRTQSLYIFWIQNHTGFKSIDIQGNSRTSIGVKTDGYIEFGLRKKEVQIVYWKSDWKSGFAFWMLQKKFELIGRKYIIREVE